MVTLTDGTSATISTAEISLFDLDTADLFYATWIDMSPLAAPDSFRIRVYVDDAQTGTERAYLDETVTGVQDPPMIYIPPIPADHYKVTMIKVTGTDRVFNWRRADTLMPYLTEFSLEHTHFVPSITLREDVSETINVSEATTPAQAMEVTVAESVNVTETRFDFMGITTAVSELINIIESSQSSKGIILAISEAINVIENSRASLAVSTVINETINVIESRFDNSTIKAFINETINVIENSHIAHVIKVAVSEIVHVMEIMQSGFGFIFAINENINVTEGSPRGSIGILLRQIGNIIFKRH